MPTDPFSILTKKSPYLGMYAGSDPYAAPEMLKEGIPTAGQEALQTPAIDPIKAALLGAGGGGFARAIYDPTLAEFTHRFTNGLFAYLSSILGNKLLGTGEEPTSKSKPNARQSR